MPLTKPIVGGSLNTWGTILNTALDELETEISSVAVNVKTYGALGDGTTNDTAAINAAIAAVVGGGLLQFPSGTYMVTPNALTAIPTGTHIQGAGVGVTFITWRPNTATTSTIWSTFRAATSATDIEIDGITFSGNRSNGNHSAAALAEAFFGLYFPTDQQRVHVHHCRFTNFRGDAMYVGRTSGQPSDITFAFNTVDDCGWKESGDGGNERQGVAFVSCDNFRVCNNHFENLPQMGVDLEADTISVDTFHNGVVSDNTFDTVGVAAVALSPKTAADAVGITIEGNTVLGTLDNGFIVRGTRVSVNGNVVSSATIIGVWILSGSTQVAVGSNVLRITNVGGAPVYVDSATRCTVVGNVLMGTASMSAIVETSGADYNFFAANTIENTSRQTVVGANTWSDAHNLGALTVDGQTILSPDQGAGLPSLLWGITGRRKSLTANVSASPWDAVEFVSNGAAGGWQGAYNWKLSHNAGTPYLGMYLRSRTDNATADLTITGGLTLGATLERAGTGSPESVVTAPVGSTFHRTDGGAGTCLYVKESGSGSTGWAAK